MVTAGANFIVGNGAVIIQGIGYSTMAGGGAFVAVGAYKQQQVKNRQSNYPGSRRQRINMQGGNVINQAVDWVGYMNSVGFIDPITNQNFHMSDVFDPCSIPDKPWYEIFGSMTVDSYSRTEVFNGSPAKITIVDRDFMNHYSENYLSMRDVIDDGNGYRMVVSFNEHGRFSIHTYDYELFKKWMRKLGY